MKRRNRGRTKNPVLVPRCGATRKVLFNSHVAAMTRAGEILEAGVTHVTMFRSYRCQFCGGWHLTSRDVK